MNEESEEEPSYIDLQNVVIEEVESKNLHENELSEFVPTKIPFNIPSRKFVKSNAKRRQTNSESSSDGGESSQPSSSKSIPAEQEAILIKKLINGEMSFVDYNLQIGQIVDDTIDDQDEYKEDDDDDIIDITTTNSSSNFEQELMQSRRDAIRGNLKGRTLNKDGKVQRRRCVLPVALMGLMGEANLCYARGQTELAEKVCLEIIRQVPLAPEPFQTLANIYESNPDKYMQFSLIAAHLNPSETEQWKRIAQLSIEQGNIKQAINCYMKASRYNPKDIDLRLRRIELLKSIGEEKLAFRCYFSMLLNIPAEQGDFLLHTAKTIAKQLLQENNVVKALEAMNTAYTKIPNLFKTDDIHFYLELLIANASYKIVLDVLCAFASLDITITQEEETGEWAVNSCRIPNDLILDFRSKLFVSLIHLRSFHLLDYLFNNINEFISVEEAGDCYLDIAEALMKEERFSDALRLLVPLVKSNNFSLAAVWLRHADCHRAIGNIEDAIESYRNVVELAPQHFDARLTLSALLKQLGRNDEAMWVLEQDMENELIDPYVLYERCFMLKETGNMVQYVDVAFLLLSRNCLVLRNRDEMQIATTIVKFSGKLAQLRESRENKSEPVEDHEGPEFGKSDNEPTVAQEWELLKDIVRIACDAQRFPMMQKIVFTMMTNKRFCPYQKELDMMATLASIYNRDSKFSYLMTKEIVVKYIDIPRVWNLFNVVLQFTEDIRYSRFLLRLFKRTEFKSITPSIVRANYFLLSGSYKYAINDYINIYRKNGDAMTALLISVTFAHLAQQKFITKKHSLIAQALAFASKYRDRREPEALSEIHYNLGRLHHQFGIIHIAVEHYKAVLHCDDSPLIKENMDLLDLKREAAFNLHLIYKESGNLDLARKVLFDYIVI